MGEEWGSTCPFPFFCDFQGALADAVRKGRREEFKAAYAEFAHAIPDPLEEATSRMAVLDWALARPRAAASGSRWCAICSRFGGGDRAAACRRKLRRDGIGGFCPERDWSLGDGDTLRLLANLSDGEANRPPNFRPLRPIWGGEPAQLLPAWSCFGAWERMMPPAIPLATYRLQLTPQFGFDQAAALVPYLKALGHQPSLRVTFLKARSAARTAMTWSTTIRSTRTRRRGGVSATVRCARSRGYRAHSRFRAQPHGRSLCG
jgi:hypothetical protein